MKSWWICSFISSRPACLFQQFRFVNDLRGNWVTAAPKIKLEVKRKKGSKKAPIHHCNGSDKRGNHKVSEQVLYLLYCGSFFMHVRISGLWFQFDPFWGTHYTPYLGGDLHLFVLRGSSPELLEHLHKPSEMSRLPTGSKKNNDQSLVYQYE